MVLGGKLNDFVYLQLNGLMLP